MNGFLADYFFLFILHLLKGIPLQITESQKNLKLS